MAGEKRDPQVDAQPGEPENAEISKLQNLNGENILPENSAAVKENSAQKEANPEKITEYRKLVEERKRNAPEELGVSLESEKKDKSKPKDIPFWFVLWTAQNEQEGAARLIVELLRDEYVYDHTEGQWYRYNGVHWEQDRISQVYVERYRVVDLYAAHAEEAAKRRTQAAKNKDKNAEQHEKYIEDLFNKQIKQLQRINYVRGVLELARSGKDRLATDGSDWDQNPNYLATTNVVIDLRTGGSREGRPRDMIRTAAPTRYDGIDAPHPRWTQFLNEIFQKDQEIIAFVQRVLGMSLIGAQLEHILVVLWGQGRNGKSVLTDVIEYVLGQLSGTIQPETLLEQSRSQSASSPTPDIMALRGKRIVWAREPEKNRKMNESQVKNLVGGDILPARSPYGRYVVNFEPTHTLVMLANDKPRANPDDYAFWERVLLVPFELSFVNREPTAPNERQRDPYLATRLKNEAPGILGWLIRGCLDWQQQGLNPPEKVKAATEQYRQDEDIIQHFIDDCCLTGGGQFTPANDLYNAYKEWCDRNGHKPLSNKHFSEKIRLRFGRGRNKQGFYYQNIGILY